MSVTYASGLMLEIIYTLGALLMIAGYILAGVALWAIVEASYWIYCKVRGIDY
jgi:hypothetical protein